MKQLPILPPPDDTAAEVLRLLAQVLEAPDGHLKAHDALLQALCEEPRKPRNLSKKEYTTKADIEARLVDSHQELLERFPGDVQIAVLREWYANKYPFLKGDLVMQSHSRKEILNYPRWWAQFGNAIASSTVVLPAVPVRRGWHRIAPLCIAF